MNSRGITQRGVFNLLFALISIKLSVVQDSISQFGGVSADDLKLNYYSPDSTAEALVIFDVGESLFSMQSKRFELVHRRKVRIKILTSDRLDWGNVRIPCLSACLNFRFPGENFGFGF